MGTYIRNEIEQTILQELAGDDPVNVTVDENAVQDEFFLKGIYEQFMKKFGDGHIIGALSRACLMAFQGGMLYERARQKARLAGSEEEKPKLFAAVHSGADGD